MERIGLYEKAHMQSDFNHNSRIRLSLRSLFVLIFLAAVAAWFAAKYVRRDRQVQFQDPNLQLAVRRAVKWSSTIRERDVAMLTELEITPSETMQGRSRLRDQPTINLVGVEKFRNLRKLTLKYLEVANSTWQPRCVFGSSRFVGQ